MSAIPAPASGPIAPAKDIRDPDVYKYWAIGLMTTSVVIGAIASLAMANYASATPPVAALHGTALGRAIIGVSIAGSIVFGISAGICAKKFKEELSQEDEERLERIRTLRELCKTGSSTDLIREILDLRNKIFERLKPAYRDTEILFPTPNSSTILHENILPEEDGTVPPTRIDVMRELLADYYRVEQAYQKRFGNQMS